VEITIKIRIFYYFLKFLATLLIFQSQLKVQEAKELM